jgi:transposase InsO family protein
VRIRANAPNELWHIDVTIVQLLDGTRVTGGTCRILLEAGRHLGTRPVETTFVTDSGMEKVNGNVDALLDREGLRRVLAQVEVSFSNSVIKAFWRSLRRLILHNLDSTATLRRLIEFYVRAHNETMHHAAFNGSSISPPRG